MRRELVELTCDGCGEQVRYPGTEAPPEGWTVRAGWVSCPDHGDEEAGR